MKKSIAEIKPDATYSAAHKGGEDDEAYYSVSVFDRRLDEQYTIARECPADSRIDAMHQHAKSQGYAHYAIETFSGKVYSNLYQRGGKLIARNGVPVEPAGGPDETDQAPSFR